MAFVHTTVQASDFNNTLQAGARLYLYAADGVTPQAGYVDKEGSTAHSHPIICSASGQEGVWLDDTRTYRIILRDAANANTYFDQLIDPSAHPTGLHIYPQAQGDQGVKTTDNVRFASLQVGDRPNGDNSDYAANTRFVTAAVAEQTSVAESALAEVRQRVIPGGPYANAAAALLVEPTAGDGALFVHSDGTTHIVSSNDPSGSLSLPRDDANLVLRDGSGNAVAEGVVNAAGVRLDRRRVATVAALAALTGATAGDVVTLDHEYRWGNFRWVPGDQSASVADDPGQGVWVAGAGDATGASGAWVRAEFDGHASLYWWCNQAPGTDDTQAIEWAQEFADSRSASATVVNSSRPIVGLYGSVRIHVPAEEFIYNGSGIIGQGRSLVWEGVHRDASKIVVTSDAYLWQWTNASAQVVNNVELSKIGFIGGRGYFLNIKTDDFNVQSGKRFFDCHFTGYTRCAIGSATYQDARWVVQHCSFYGPREASWYTANPNANVIGVLLPHEVAELDISGNTFGGNHYDIKTMSSGQSSWNIGPNNTFIDLEGQARRARIWLVPDDESDPARPSDKSQTVLGTDYSDPQDFLGCAIFDNRFSNENDTGSPVILVAAEDEASGPHSGERSHSTAAVDHTCTGLRIRGNRFQSIGEPNTHTSNRGIILSYTSRFGPFYFGPDNMVGSWRPAVLEYDSAVTAVPNGLNLKSVIYSSRYDLSAYRVRPCNRAFGGKVINHGAYLGDQGEEEPTGPALGVTDLVSSSQQDIFQLSTGASVTVANRTTDRLGGDNAATVTFGADQEIAAPITVANIPQGKKCWVSFDVRKADSNSLDAIQAFQRIGSQQTFETIYLTDEWKTIHLPLLVDVDPTTVAVFVNLRPMAFLSVGSKDSVKIGRVRVYESDTPTIGSRINLTPKLYGLSNGVEPSYVPAFTYLDIDRAGDVVTVQGKFTIDDVPNAITGPLIIDLPAITVPSARGLAGVDFAETPNISLTSGSELGGLVDVANQRILLKELNHTTGADANVFSSALDTASGLVVITFSATYLLR